MDSEIGVRDLADTFRYNTLPPIVRRLKLSDDPHVDFEDLPEYMHMVALSRAQAELNFAVYYSYLHDHVMMIDTMTSSIEYRNFDQDRKDMVGFRLPADPYWLSPPQGSIVPIWHDGGAPNYQPKPMICKHVQDPIKAWRRELPDHLRTSKKGLIQLVAEEHGVRPKIRIFSCSAGVNAGKMAHKLHDILERVVHEVDDAFDIEHEKPLNQLSLSDAGPEDVILIIASTTGRGEIPFNAARFVKTYETADPLAEGQRPRFSCFANGDSTYGDSYNAAGKQIQAVMTRMGCRALLGHCFAGDTAQHNPDWHSFNTWLENIDHLILGNHHKIELPKSLTEMRNHSTALTEMPTATLVQSRRLDPNGLYHITLDIGSVEYQKMDHIKILTPNLDVDVHRVMAALQIKHSDDLSWHHQKAHGFFSRYVDLDHNFRTLAWYPGFEELPEDRREHLRDLKVPECLDTLHTPLDKTRIEAACKDMASIQPRLYSVASCPEHSNDSIQEEDTGNMVDIVVKMNTGGRFSDQFLRSARIGAQLRFGLTRPDSWKMVQAQEPNAPFVAFCTGSGIGPIRAVLQRRLIDIIRTSGHSGRPRAQRASHSTSSRRSSIDTGSRGREASVMNPVQIETTMGSIEDVVDQPLIPLRSRSNSVASDGATSVSRTAAKNINHHAHLGVSSTRGSVSLFAGFKKEDADMFHQMLRPASHAGLFDMLELLPSNPEKIRVQDRLLVPDSQTRLAALLKDPSCIVFLCTNDEAAKVILINLSLIAGANIQELLRERYIEEIFRG